MKNIQEITSLSNQRIKQLVQWGQKAKQREKDGIFLVEGKKMFEEAPKGWILQVYFSKNFVKKWQPDLEHILMEKAIRESQCAILSDEVFAKVSSTVTPQGVLCVVKRPEYKLQDFLQNENPLLILLENLQDPGNMGTILRTGEGAGVCGVIASKDTVDIYNPKTVRATMGSIYRMPVMYVDDLLDIMQTLHKKNIHTYAAHLKAKKDYDQCDFIQGTAILIGNEGNGLSDRITEASENYLKIPMDGHVESLNASVAAAILMYEAKRQRKSV